MNSISAGAGRIIFPPVMLAAAVPAAVVPEVMDALLAAEAGKAVGVATGDAVVKAEEEIGAIYESADVNQPVKHVQSVRSLAAISQ